MDHVIGIIKSTTLTTQQWKVERGIGSIVEVKMQESQEQLLGDLKNCKGYHWKMQKNVKKWKNVQVSKKKSLIE